MEQSRWRHNVPIAMSSAYQCKMAYAEEYVLRRAQRRSCTLFFLYQNLSSFLDRTSADSVTGTRVGLLEACLMRRCDQACLSIAQILEINPVTCPSLKLIEETTLESGDCAGNQESLRKEKRIINVLCNCCSWEQRRSGSVDSINVVVSKSHWNSQRRDR
ncbi:hypothetical protein VNO77_19893 [Canavalia gladiata]|uniref:Uncharacterized protein n=1 Tax=Canavalia gladiata TaxID=3824 RepID=A0AAN9LNG2_CANGL